MAAGKVGTTWVSGPSHSGRVSPSVGTQQEPELVYASDKWVEGPSHPRQDVCRSGDIWDLCGIYGVRLLNGHCPFSRERVLGLDSSQWPILGAFLRLYSP